MAPPRQVERARVAWIDTDAGARIHFTAAFRWAEAAETSLFRTLGIPDQGSYPRRAVEAEYLAVLVFEDELEIELTPERLGTTSITYTWTIHRDGELCVRGRHTVVRVDNEGRPTELDDDARRLLSGV
ncbi:MAG: acyl-CoA thioesterase [Actinobacteria bacterium]|nr:acyl-CoA thioesterase [Actinomycetota bacterium]